MLDDFHKKLHAIDCGRMMAGECELYIMCLLMNRLDPDERKYVASAGVAKEVMGELMLEMRNKVQVAGISEAEETMASDKGVELWTALNSNDEDATLRVADTMETKALTLYKMADGIMPWFLDAVKSAIAAHRNVN